jgi:hypothetical protein
MRDREAIRDYELLSPHEKQDLLRSSDGAPFLEKLKYDALPRPNYAYGTYHAALQARALALPRISVIEFGVAGGNGLVELESVAFAVERETGVEIDVYGFDTGEGMPMPVDHRDMPYVWQPGFFKMDVAALEARLRKAKLVLGNVSTTVPQFLERTRPAPIGFASIDLDYYSSTVEALRIFENRDPSTYLPRIFLYLDDIIGDDWELHSEFAGELLAVKEFSERHTQRKIGKINCLRYKRMLWSPWVEQMFVLHLFDHPKYCTYVNPKQNWQAPL